MLRFVDMRGAYITGVSFGFWDTVTNSMLTLADEQGWETFDALQASAEEAGRADLLPRLRGLCPDWVHVPRTKAAAIVEILHRLGVHNPVGGDLRNEELDAPAVRAVLQRLVDPEDEGSLAALIGCVAETLLRELDDVPERRQSEESGTVACARVRAGTRERCVVVPFGQALRRDDLASILRDYMHPHVVDIHWTRDGWPCVDLVEEDGHYK